MNTPLANNPLVNRLTLLSQLAAVSVILIGCMGMAGWLFDIAIFRSLLPGLATMKFNTALAFALSGLALLKLKQPHLARAIGVFLTLLGLFTVAEYLFNINLGIDNLINPDRVTPSTNFPGRMSIVTAFNFICIGIGLLFVRSPLKRLTQVLISLPAFFAFMALAGYLYDVEALYRVGSLTSIALHTTLTFILVCCAMLGAYPEWGLARLLTSISAGGYIARRLLPATLLIPVIGWLCWQGALRGWYDIVFGLALFAVVNVFIAVALVSRVALTLHSTDQERAAALEALYLVNSSLEAQIAARTQDLTQANTALTEQIKQRTLAEELFRALMESAPDAAIMVNSSGEIALINAQTEVLFGYTRQELIGKPIEILIPEPFSSRHADHRDDYQASPRVRAMGAGLELYGLRRDGSQFPVEISLSPIKTPDGNLIASSIRDITSRKAAEAALQANEEKLQTIFDLLPVGASLINNDKQIVQMNLALQRILDMSMPELLQGKYRSRQYIHPDGTPVHPSEFPSERASAEQRAVVDVEIGVIKEDGVIVWTSVSAAPLPHNHGVVVVTVDITQRKEAEADLRESERQFRLVAENSPDVIYVLDVQEYRPKYLNRPEFLGYSQAEIERTGSLVHALHPEDQARVMAHWQNILVSGAGMIEYRLKDKAEEWQWIQSRETTFMAASDGKPTHLLVTLSIITERKLAEHQALELEKQREHVKILSDFVRDTSHDFRTPITALSTSLYLLTRSTEPDKQQRHIDNAEHHITRLTELIDRLLMMARLDSPIQLVFERVDTNRLGAECYEQIRFEADKKQITVTQNLYEFELIVQGNRVELTQALVELGQNAIKYTPPHGTITLQTYEQDNQAVIEVTDTGVGIPADDLPLIFQRLYRVDKARSTETGGAGLGLSIAKRIVELHHGSLTVESVPEKGSTFRIILPLSV
jgi:PAS domain S-box-containing protein